MCKEKGVWGGDTPTLCSDEKQYLEQQFFVLFFCVIHLMTSNCSQNLWRRIGKGHKGKPTPK